MAKKWSQKTIPIDVEALRGEFAKRGLTLAGASRDMGHCDSYINAKMSLGSVNANDAKMLELLFHIPQSAYEVVEQTEEIPEEPEAESVVASSVELDYDKLYQTIYSAVFAAVKEAFK